MATAPMASEASLTPAANSVRLLQQELHLLSLYCVQVKDVVWQLTASDVCFISIIGSVRFLPQASIPGFQISALRLQRLMYPPLDGQQLLEVHMTGLQAARRITFAMFSNPEYKIGMHRWVGCSCLTSTWVGCRPLERA